MPCWEISRFTIKFTVANKEFLVEALKRLNMEPVLSESYNIIYCPNESLEIDLDKEEVSSVRLKGTYLESTMNKVKRKYSEVVLEEVARRNKWLLKKKREQNQFVLRRY